MFVYIIDKYKYVDICCLLFVCYYSWQKKIYKQYIYIYNIISKNDTEW